MKKFSDFNIITQSPLEGRKIPIMDVLNVNVIVRGFRVANSKFPRANNDRCVYMQIEVDGVSRVLFTGSGIILSQLEQIPENGFPFKAKIIRSGQSFQLSDPNV